MRVWLARKLLPKSYKIIRVVYPTGESDSVSYVQTGPAQPANSKE